MTSLLIFLYLAFPGTDSLSTALSKTAAYDHAQQQQIIRLKQDPHDDYDHYAGYFHD